MDDAKQTGMFAGLVMIFLLLWGLPQFLSHHTAVNEVVWQVLFSVGFLVLAGAILPKLYLDGYAPMKPRRQMPWLGVLIVLAVFLIGLVLTGSLVKIFGSIPSPEELVQQGLLAFPMAIAVSLMAFVVIPDFVYHGPWYVLFSTLFVFFGFLIDSGFTDLGMPFRMAVMAFLLLAGHYFHGSIALSSLSFFVILLAFRLAEGKTQPYPYFLLIPVFLVSLWVFITMLSKPRQSDPGL